MLEGEERMLVRLVTPEARDWVGEEVGLQGLFQESLRHLQPLLKLPSLLSLKVNLKYNTIKVTKVPIPKGHFLTNSLGKSMTFSKTNHVSLTFY